MEASFDPCITRIGFGAWAIDGSGWSFGWGSEADGDAIAAIRHALDHGVDWIDTSAVEGLADSGEVARGFFVFLPVQRACVLGKCGLIFEDVRPAGEPRRSRWPASIREECEASL